MGFLGRRPKRVVGQSPTNNKRTKMQNTQARKIASEQVKVAMKTAGLLDGISLQAQQLHNETKPCFWRGVVKNEVARSKDIYVVWSIPTSTASERADDKIYLREVTISVDIFSKRSFESEQNYKLLQQMENAFELAGFEVEFADEQYENNTGLYHYPLTLYKIYGGKNK